MTRRTRSHAQYSDAPPPIIEPIPKQGGHQNVNDLRMEELPEHRPGKEPMTFVPDNGIDLGDIARRTERVEDMIETVQSTVNQLNQFLLQATGQGIQLFQTTTRPTQQAPSPHLGGNRNHEQVDESLVELADHQAHRRRKSHSPQKHRGDMQGGNDVRGDLPHRH